MIQKKICMVGAYGVGKTSLVRRFVESIFDERYITTIGVKTDKKVVAVDGNDVMMMLYDIAGEEDEAPFRTTHVRGADGYILVADGMRPGTLEVAEDVKRRVDEVTGVVPFVLAINKADVKEFWRMESSDIERVKSEGWTVFETSAKDGLNVEALFLDLATRVSAV